MSANQKIALVAITQNGFELAQKYVEYFPEMDIYSKYGTGENVIPIEGRLSELVKQLFQKYESLVFIMATGIVVRCIAPLLEHKSKDPAVLVVDEAGQFVISLLSGHWGGANVLAELIARKTGATAVITTASDTQGKQSIDMFAKQHGLKIGDWKTLTRLTAIMVNGGEIAYINKTAWELPIEDAPKEVDATVYISHREEAEGDANAMTLFAPNLILGVGCRRNTEPEKLVRFVRQELAALSCPIEAVAEIASIDIKHDEAAILDLAKDLGVDLQFFSKEEIASVEHLFEGSDFVKRTLGVSAVSEPTAYLAGKGEGRFLLHKVKSNGMTLSVFEIL